MKKLAFVFAAAFFSSVCASFGGTEEIKIGGGGAAISQTFVPMEEPFEKSTGILLTLEASTPVKGIIALEKGKVDAATAAHSLNNIIATAAREGVTIDPSSLQTTEMGMSRTVVMVHKSNPIAALTKDQLRDIFTGKTTNWKQLGGRDEPVIVVWGKGTPGQNALFTKAILDGKTVVAAARAATDYQNIRDTVAATPGAIGIDPAGFVSASINTPEIPLIQVPIILITKGDPSPKVKKLIRFYEEEFAMFQR